MAEAAPALPPEAGGSPLPAGSELHEFRIERVLGEGGFGIVYLATDLQLQRTVALKEYMPSSLAARQTGFGVAVRSERHRETFELGLRSFVNEARLLASFDHPSLVKVYRFWEQNGTAYMVMPYYEGPTLKAWLRQQPQPPAEDWLKRLLHPLLDALELIHADRCYHRDIAPDNILLLGPQHRPVLLDFGAARRVIGDATQALTTILKPGYAPIEQYAEVPSMKQGAWTDVYALCAVLYAALTGRPPMAAVGRMMKDEMVPISQTAAGRCSAPFLAAIDEGLSLRPERRPQSIAALRERLFAVETASADATVLQAPVDGERTVIAPGGVGGPLRGAPADGAGGDDATVIASATPPSTRAAAAPAMTAPPASKAGLAVLVSVGALAIATAAVWYFTAAPETPAAAAPAASTALPRSTPAVTRDAADAAVAPAAPAPPPDVPVAAVAARPLFGTVAVLNDIVARADPQIAVRVSADKQRLVIGRDRLAFRVRASEPGHLYVFFSGTDGAHLALLFPNAIDQDNRVEADTELVLPRRGWQITADGPPGADHIVAMVSRQPRDWAAAPAKAGEAIPEFDLAALQQAWNAGPTAGTPWAGEARCRGTPGCDARFGAALVRVDEVAPK